MKLYFGELGPTATYPHRWWSCMTGDPLRDGRAATLTVGLHRPSKSSTRVEIDRYAVEYDEQTGVFRLTNETDPAAAEPYLCEPGVECGCAAGRFRSPAGCKHDHALAAARKAGAFPEPAREPAPEPEPEPEPVYAGGGGDYDDVPF